MSDSISEDYDKFRKASFMDIMKINAYIIKLNLKKQNRTPEVVDKEYNSGVWNRTFEDIDFESVSGNWNRNDMNEIQIFRINNELKKMGRREFEERSKNEFLLFFKDLKDDEIVELGCGLGANLFYLYRSGFKKLSGSDISKNAINNLRKYVKSKKIDINFETMDLNEELPQNFIKNKIVFTYDCLEQCKHTMPNILRNIVNGQPKLVMSFETYYESAPNMVKKYFDARDYQNNLVTELKKIGK